MKNLHNIKKIGLFILGLFVVASCEEKLNEANINPYGIDPATANPNLLLPSVLAPAAQTYVDLGFNDLAGAVQHTQKNGWYDAHNQYNWGPRDWANWYDMLRTNDLMIQRGEALGQPFFVGVGLTMKSFIFGNITDLWGDAPYTNALKGNQGGTEFQYPLFDSQEVIYTGIIEDLKRAADIFAGGSTEGLNAANDLYYGGNANNWQRFANSLLLRYYMRISEKKPDVAKAGIESIYNSGVYIQSPNQDATLDYTGGSNDVWLSRHVVGEVNDFQRYQASQTFIEQLTSTNDPRLTVWFDSVRVQWVPDPTLNVDFESFIRADGVPVTDPVSFDQFESRRNEKFTRRFNPNRVSFNTDLYVGLPPGIAVPESYNGNLTPGQGTQNIHVSQLAPIYATAGAAGDILKARIISAAEVSFILAEAALKGWGVGDAESHYNNAIKNSLDTWGKGDAYNTFISQPDIKFNNTLEQIITQKWVASWTAAAESFVDYRRTGYPALQAGPMSQQPRVALRFRYGNDEYSNNAENLNAALQNLETTPFSGNLGADSPWSKPWVAQGTSKPW
ncbi:MAG TPA: SusD/RagB family nutrient-binding outer membrane lipoprotein [Cyclobacteriaceae bacterium]|nr:SusD/RagB family nutrient-binding outer membrane lipoprotein [Cyclobacteriaceae bacterium]